MILNPCTRKSEMIDENAYALCHEAGCRHAGKMTTEERIIWQDAMDGNRTDPGKNVTCDGCQFGLMCGESGKTFLCYHPALLGTYVRHEYHYSCGYGLLRNVRYPETSELTEEKRS